MRFLLGIATASFASMAVAEGDAQTALIVDAIVEAGCEVSAEDADRVFGATGLEQVEIFAAVQALFETGQAVLEPDGSISLQTEACQ